MGRRIAAVLAVTSLLAPAAAVAGPKAKAPAAKAKPAGTAPAPAVSDALAGSQPAPVLTFDPMTIEGRIQKPQAIYSLQRSAPAFSELAPEETFVPKILTSVEEDPF
jgi:hypothetical protein